MLLNWILDGSVVSCDIQPEESGSKPAKGRDTSTLKNLFFFSHITATRRFTLSRKSDWAPIWDDTLSVCENVGMRRVRREAPRVNLSEDKFLDTLKGECETPETLGSLISQTEEDEEERQPKGVGPQLHRRPAATREPEEHRERWMHKVDWENENDSLWLFDASHGRSVVVESFPGSNKVVGSFNWITLCLAK